MQSYEFEVKCKNALAKILKEKYQFGDGLTIKDLHLVWFAKVLGNFKCLIIDLLPNGRYYECTYNGAKDELYIDIYDKQHNIVLKGNELSSIVNL